jgi:hypothetical protein
MILNCTCKSEYQDEKYGKGRRVHNPMQKSPNGPQEWRCTVCKTERIGPREESGR